MTITKTINGSEAVFKLEGWLDTQAAPELDAEIEALDPAIESLIMDFEGVEYIASSGVREVVTAYKKVNGNLTLKNVSEGIMDIFSATGIDKKITFA